MLILLSRKFVYDYQRVTGISMLNNLKENDIVIIDKTKKIFDRFDIVVLKNEEDELVVKRIIGLPGESIGCEDGKVYINENILKETYVSSKTSTFSIQKIPKDKYFVMGDNRSNSIDSRVYGPVKTEKIVGKVIKVIKKY